MRMLITGASSGLAAGVIQHLLLNTDAEIWCGRHRNDITISNPRLNVIALDLESDINKALYGLHFDIVVHLAGVTHSSDVKQYWKVNFEATRRLARAVHGNGCGRFVYVSTRCATVGAGAYGESKLAAEQELQKLQWKSLLIIRPAEVYGREGAEGIDRLVATGRKWRIIPALFGHRNLSFAPLHMDDFCKHAAQLILERNAGVAIENMCGPEDLTGIMLAQRIGRHYRALPIPVWWPLAASCLRTLHRFRIDLVKPDQLDRLVCQKTATAESNKKTPPGVRRFLLE